MRDNEHDLTDTGPPALGAPIRQPAPAPRPRQISPGIWQRPDGALETRIPLPVVRQCGTCGHAALPYSDEPCKSCNRSVYSNWEQRA